METVVTARVPAAEFAFATMFEVLPDVEVEVEPVIESNSETATPIVRMRGSNPDALDNAFAADSSVKRASSLDHQKQGNTYSYQVAWSDDVYQVLKALTSANGSILDMCSQHGEWRFQMLYPDRENLLEAHKHWTEHGLTVDVERIHGVDSHPATNADSTEP